MTANRLPEDDWPPGAAQEWLSDQWHHLEMAEAQAGIANGSTIPLKKVREQLRAREPSDDTQFWLERPGILDDVKRARQELADGTTFSEAAIRVELGTPHRVATDEK
jgi:hypothetical protein